MSPNVLALAEILGEDYKNLVGPPPHAGGVARPYFFDKKNAVYNWKVENTRKLKAGLGLGGYFGATRGGIFVISDSISEGQVGAGSWNQMFSWPTVLQMALTAGGSAVRCGAGGVLDGGVYMPFGSSSANAVDNRLAKAGAWTNNNNGYITGANGATLTFPSVNVFPLAVASGTAVDVAYEYVAGSGFTVSIDGGTAVSVPMTGSGYKHYTVTGLADGPHTVVITVTTATAPRLIGLSIYRPYGFMVYNMAKSGATAEEWSVFTPGLLHPHRYNSLPPGTTDIGAILLGLGANDMALNDRTAAQIKTYLQGVRALYPAPDVILMNYPEGLSPHAQFAAYNEMLYDLADEWDCPLIDNLAWTGGWAVANPNNIMSADGAHPNTRYHAALGARMANILTT